MSKALMVVPYIYKPYFDAFFETYDGTPELLAIDNREHNAGVAGSWDQGIDEMRKRGADWLIVCSAAMRFGTPGGSDIQEQIDAHPDADIIRFAPMTTAEVRFNPYDKAKNPPYPECFYWHLTAVNKRVFDRIGKFDPNFYPVYFEDTDYDLRIKKAGNFNDIIAPIDAHSAGTGHAVQFAGVKSPSEPPIAYFAEKWGRHPSAAQLGEYNYPFNNSKNSLAFFPSAHGVAWNE